MKLPLDRNQIVSNSHFSVTDVSYLFCAILFIRIPFFSVDTVIDSIRHYIGLCVKRPLGYHSADQSNSAYKKEQQDIQNRKCN